MKRHRRVIHSLWHKQTKVRELFYCHAEQTISDSEEPLSSSFFLPPTNTYFKMSLSPETQAFCKTQSREFRIYLSGTAHIAGKWDTPAQLEAGGQGWLLTCLSALHRGQSTGRAASPWVCTTVFRSWWLVSTRRQGQLSVKVHCLETEKSHRLHSIKSP